MKRAIRTLGWRFSADRMVMDYVLQVLHPGRRRHEQRRQPHVNYRTSNVMCALTR